MFFASMVKDKACGGRNQNIHTNTDLSNYKRLLDKVSSKIERWHRGLAHQNRVLFTKDDEYVEDEKSPTSFSTSSSESDVEGSPNDLAMRLAKTQLPKSGFSLNLVQTELHTKSVSESQNKSQIIYRPK